MITSRRTAKHLNWAGAVVLGCLGLALLPAAVRAQQPTPNNVVPIQVQPAKKTPSLDEQIEALRCVLQQLEEQKRKEQGQAAPAKPGDPGSPWPANWKEINKVVDDINRLLREVEENGTLLKAGEIKLGRAHAELALLKAKSPADPKETNKVIDEINRLLREDEESRTLFNAANIRLRRAYAEVEKLKGSSASSRVLPSNVIPVQVSPR
jgi:hypothetical protein